MEAFGEEMWQDMWPRYKEIVTMQGKQGKSNQLSLNDYHWD